MSESLWDILIYYLPRFEALKEVKVSIISVDGRVFQDLIQSLPQQTTILRLEDVRITGGSRSQPVSFPTGLAKVSLVRCSFGELRSSFIKGLLSVKRLKVLNDDRSGELSLEFLSLNKHFQRDVTSGLIKKRIFNLIGLLKCTSIGKYYPTQLEKLSITTSKSLSSGDISCFKKNVILLSISI